MMGLIGFIVGFLGFLLHQIIERLTDVRIERAREYLAVSWQLSQHSCDNV